MTEQNLNEENEINEDLVADLIATFLKHNIPLREYSREELIRNGFGDYAYFRVHTGDHVIARSLALAMRVVCQEMEDDDKGRI